MNIKNINLEHSRTYFIAGCAKKYSDLWITPYNLKIKFDSNISKSEIINSNAKITENPFMHGGLGVKFADLLPNFQEIVKKHMKHDLELLKYATMVFYENKNTKTCMYTCNDSVLEVRYKYFDISNATNYILTQLEV